MTHMPFSSDSFQAKENLEDFLSFHGWSPISEGHAGKLWEYPETKDEIAIPHGMRPDTGLWDGTLEMIAHYQRADKNLIEREVLRFWMDVTEFRAVSSVVSGNNIAAGAGSALFSGAWKILRSSATTARGAKVSIGGKYSSAGDRAIDRAMFAQTEPGSYILPLLVPLERTLNEKNAREFAEQVSTDDFFQAHVSESEQRRTTRTMAQALSAVSKVLVEPAIEPTARAINDVVMAGASKELVKALHDIINGEGVSSLDMTFSWAPKAGKLAHIQKKIEVPTGASEILLKAAKRMNTTKEPMAGLLSGPIIALYHPKGQHFGEATIEAPHRGRVRRIVVSLRGNSRLDAAHKWFHSHETLLVSGALRSTAEGLKIDDPHDIRPLSETTLL